ncbi:clan AA aspartic protease [Chamaesiphon sp. OTE_20_metabat_361]|uniref:clan AA aspartic protease n=1 Tax=Chamaesiphon sp. OTE_20_metabat_361 TaxID=2964689 RepID=UPI00286D3C2F|nr:clan AA aspartic protease [Chamaesiphon sp. OTE_20_metabat_361]
MIRGKFIDKKIVLPVRFLLSQEMIFDVEFVVDTGFNGYLTLPVGAVGAMNLPLFSTTATILADGSQSLTPTHLATIDWHGEEVIVPVLAMGGKPLLGTGLLSQCRLLVEFTENGAIELEKL